MRFSSATCSRASLLFLLAFLASIQVVTGGSSFSFAAHSFEASVAKALKQVESILNHTRDLPRLAHLEQGHVYEDKYALAEMLSNTAVAAAWNDLDVIGLSDDGEEKNLQTLLDWVHRDGSSVTLHFQFEESCEFVKEQEVDAINSRQQETEETVIDERGGTTVKKSLTRVTQKTKEFHWKVDLTYRLFVCPGITCDEKNRTIVLRDGKVSSVVVTSSKHPPIETSGPHSERLNLTWLLKMLSRDDRTSLFRIDRGAETCKTPRRNDDVGSAIEFFTGLHMFSDYVLQSFSSVHTGPNVLRKAVQKVDGISGEVFHPVLPLMENSTALAGETIALFLEEQQRSIKHAVAQLSDMFPPDSKDDESTLSFDEATLVLAFQTIKALSLQYVDSITYVENMLRNQLFQAIGKELTPDHFDEYMRYHSQRLLGPDYVPKLFSYAIRQPNQYPVGVLSIEGAAGKNELAQTMTRHIPGGSPVRIPINAATQVEMTGDIFLSGWMRHSFASEPGTDEETILAARARQFSSFVVLVGTMAGSDIFSPKHAIILQNKDEVLIPLLTETLPSAREFQDAIVSLSPEQQAFAKAFRGMQLESSVFGVCVIQLRPQLEKLLGLPDGALTKEIQLTQDLMSLFVDYQIPSDLLSFDGAPEMEVAEKIAVVKAYVKAVLDVIDSTKDKLLAEEQRKAEAAKAKRNAMRENMVYHADKMGEYASASSVLDSMGSYTLPSEERNTASRAHRNLRASAAASAEPEYQAPGSVDESTAFSDNLVADVTSKTDFTLLPKILDSKLEEHDADGYLRSTLIKAASTWTQKRQENLLTPMKSSMLNSSDLDVEKKKSFDLLDAISRSGTLPIASSELHVIVAVTHCFDKSLVATLIEDNINPIEKVEKSILLLASTIYGEPAKALSDRAVYARLAATFPRLFALDAHAAGSDGDTDIE